MPRITSGARRLAFAAALGLLLCLPASLTAADRPWVEVKSPHFTAISDAGDKPAREVLWAFEQMRLVIHGLFPWAGVDLNRPIVLLLVHNESAMRQLLPDLDERKQTFTPPSMPASGPDRYYIALRADRASDQRIDNNEYRQAFSSYINFTFQTGLARELPPWLRSGLTTAVSNTYVHESSLDVGYPVVSSVQRLRGVEGIPLADVVAAETYEPFANNPPRMAAFTAEAWGLAHYLMFARDGAYRERLSQFLKLVFEGKASAVAFQLAYGDVDAMNGEFRSYFRQMTVPFKRVEADASVSRSAFTMRELLISDAAVMRGGFHTARRRLTEARAELATARAHMSPAATFELEGLLFEADRNFGLAQASYTRAIELGSTNFYAYYRCAALTASREQAALIRKEQLLERAVTLDPLYGPARTLLANTKVDLGRPGDALEHARLGVRLDPGVFNSRYALAAVMWRLSMRDDAVREIREALAIARNDTERSLAQTTLDTYLKAVAR